MTNLGWGLVTAEEDCIFYVLFYDGVIGDINILKGSATFVLFLKNGHKNIN